MPSVPVGDIVRKKLASLKMPSTHKDKVEDLDNNSVTGTGITPPALGGRCNSVFDTLLLDSQHGGESISFIRIFFEYS